MFLPLLAAQRSVATLHGLHLLRRATGVRRRAAELNLRAVVRAADRTICVSAAERDVLSGRIVGPAASALGRSSFTTAPGSLLETGAADRAQVREQLGLTQRLEPVGIWVGSLDERRDPLAVVRAAERTSTPLLIVGRRTATRRSRTSRRCCTSACSASATTCRTCSALPTSSCSCRSERVSPSRCSKRWHHGLPAIVADIPENIEAVGDSGLAVPYGDEEATAAAFLRLARDEPERTDPR